MKLLFENWRQYLNESRVDFIGELIDALIAINTDDERVQNWRGNFVSMLKIYQRLARKNPEKANKYLETANETPMFDDKTHHQWLQEYAPEFAEGWQRLLGGAQ